MNRFAIILSTFALLAVSCNKEDPHVHSGITVETEYPIFFADASFTKVYSENTSDEIKTGGFGVACVTDAGSKLFIEKASWVEAKSCYIPAGGPWFYPSEGKVNFYAVYPESQSLTFSGEGVSLSYAQNGDLDLLAAKKEDVSGGLPPVALSFEHILSLIHFRAVDDDTEASYKVKSVRIAVPAAGKFSYENFRWIPTDGTGTEVCYEGEITVGESTEIPSAVTFIPCNPEITVSWEVYSPDGGTFIASHDKTSLLENTLEMGEECTVTVRFGASGEKKMSLAVEVSPWTSTDREIEIN